MYLYISSLTSDIGKASVFLMHCKLIKYFVTCNGKVYFLESSVCNVVAPLVGLILIIPPLPTDKSSIFFQLKDLWEWIVVMSFPDERYRKMADAT